MSDRTRLVKDIRSVGVALTIGLSVSATVFADDHDNEYLVKKWQCTSCHGLSQRIVGPSFLEIARSGILNDVNRIVKVIREGSKNAWGIIPMPPMPNVPETDARNIAKWILGLDNKLVAGVDKISTSNVVGTSVQTPSSSLPTQPQPFVTISPDPSRSFQARVAWWLRADYQPYSRDIRGIPVKEIANDWCYANEFTKDIFPPVVYEESLGLDEILKEGRSFSLVRKFGTNQQTALVGVYETCDGKAGTFLMLLKTNRHGKSKVAYLRKYEKAFFAYLIPGPKNRILFADCYGCDSASVYTWTKSMFAENIVLKGESVCINRDSVIYSSADEHSRPVYETDKLENAEVLNIGLQQGDYFWHQVKLNIGKTGYVLNSAFNFEPGLCE